jgi:hypothetical protein
MKNPSTSPACQTSLFVLAFIILSTLNISAQKLKVGIRGGVSFANFTGHNASGQSYTSPETAAIHYNPNYNTSLVKDLKIGQTYTLYADYVLDKNWDLEIGIGYCQKGIDLNYHSTSHTESNGNTIVTRESVIKNFRSNYITLPAAIKLKLGAKKHFYLTGGVYTAFLLKMNINKETNAKDVMTYDTNHLFISEMKSEDHFNEGYLHRIDFGLTGGAGFEIPLNDKWSFGLDMRINKGFVNLPANYSKHHFFNFSSTTKNINMESTIKIAYSLR